MVGDGTECDDGLGWAGLGMGDGRRYVTLILCFVSMIFDRNPHLK